MGSTACDRLTEDADFGKNFIFSDGAHFDFVGYVNKQNCRIWGTENPHAYTENPTHPKRVTHPEYLLGIPKKRYLAEPV